MHCKHEVEYKQYLSHLEEGRKKTRHRPTIQQKKKVIDIVIANPGISHSDIARTHNTTSSAISKWMKQRFDIESWRDQKGKKVQRVESRGIFHECEVELYARFLERRVKHALYVDGIWLKHQMHLIMNVLKPRGYHTFCYSNGWCYRFCKRWHITSQARTDGKTESPEVRRAKIVAVLGKYMEIQNSGPVTDPAYGRFQPDQHWHVDGIPMPFSHPRYRSLNPVNSPCRISGVVEGGWAKRQATVHLCIRALGEQVVPAVVILRGYGRSQSAEEMAAWLGLSHVLVYYQPRAYCDAHFQRWWLVNVFNKYVRASGDLREQLLCLDNFSAHRTPSVQELMKELDIVPHWLPAGCTDVAAPVDHHVGALLKLLVRSAYEESLEDPVNFAMWREHGAQDSLSTAKRRMWICKWNDIAWGKMRTMELFLLKSFLSTGALMERNGNNFVRMRGIPQLD